MRASNSINGIGASPGIAIGTAFVLDARRVRAPKIKLRDGEAEPEVTRFNNAIAISDTQLADLKTRITEGGRDGAEHALILEAHRLILHDPMFVNDVVRLIRKDLINAEWAVRRVSRKLRHQFNSIDDEYFRERKSDVEFVTDRVARNLMGEAVDEELEVPPGAIVVARDISPADAALLVRNNRIGGFLSDLGSQTSHAAIIARARGIPAVVALTRMTQLIRNGDEIALDGARGEVFLNPTAEQRAQMQETLRQHYLSLEEALKLAGLPAVTTDGVTVRMNGNIEFPEEVTLLLENGGQGVGLYRTEFLLLNRSSPPSEEEHFESYRQVLQSMRGRPVTIRTLDLGGDKIPGKKVDREANPALGLRAIRYCLKHRELFRVQLRALLRASAFGELRIMFPMISGISELREARSELEACRSELTRHGVPMGKRVPIGIMMETPSAAWTADRLAQEADFFSIGTNDLIQYTLAIDRQNRDVEYLYQPLHLAIIRSLQAIIVAAKSAGIPVAMCGEMAGDPRLTLVLIALGIEEFSMSAGQIPMVKSAIRTLSRSDASAVLDHALQFSSAEEIGRFINTEVDARSPKGASSA